MSMPWTIARRGTRRAASPPTCASWSSAPMPTAVVLFSRTSQSSAAPFVAVGGEPQEQVGPPAVDEHVLLPAHAVHLLVGQAYGVPQLVQDVEAREQPALERVAAGQGPDRVRRRRALGVGTRRSRARRRGSPATARRRRRRSSAGPCSGRADRTARPSGSAPRSRSAASASGPARTRSRRRSPAAATARHRAAAAAGRAPDTRDARSPAVEPPPRCRRSGTRPRSRVRPLHSCRDLLVGLPRRPHHGVDDLVGLSHSPHPPRC